MLTNRGGSPDLAAEPTDEENTRRDCIAIETLGNRIRLYIVVFVGEKAKFVYVLHRCGVLCVFLPSPLSATSIAFTNSRAENKTFRCIAN